MTCHPLNRWRVRRLALAALGLAAVQAATAQPGKFVSVQVRNLSAKALSDVPVTFGQVVRKGDIPRGYQILCLVDQRLAQVDVKRGPKGHSACFAVVSTILKNLPPGGTRTLTLGAGSPLPMPALRPVFLGDLLKTDFDAVVTLTFPDGAVRSASARKLLERAGSKAKTWLSGHIATEWLVCAAPVDKDGKPDEDLNVRFQVRAYDGCKRVRVSVVVENCWDTWAGNIRYDARVTVGGKEVFAKKAVDHRKLSRWRKVFWWGEGEPPVHVAHDLAYLSASGALPNYDRTLPPGRPNWQTKRIRAMAGPPWDILGRGALTAYMPTTGGRPEIAPYPAWAVRYLLTMEPRWKTVVLRSGDLAGSWPIHVRARKTGRVLTIDERPQFWLDPRGKDRPHWKPDRHQPDPKQQRLSPDLAHQGSFAYIPYLVTGDSYYLEEAYFWAGYCLVATWYHPRQGAKGILSGQIRGNAWALRNIADAAWLATKGDPEAAYFDRRVRNNIADRIRRMLGPPEYNKIGAWGVRDTRNARIQKPANPNWMVQAPWEEDYLLWSFHHLVELGYPDAAKPRDFLLRLRVGMLTHAPDFNPMLATPYRLVIGERRPDKTVVFYEDWKTLGRENARLSKPRLGNSGGSYTYSARAAIVCGIDGGFPKAREALAWLHANLPNRRQVLARNPSWAIVPRVGSDLD